MNKHITFQPYNCNKIDRKSVVLVWIHWFEQKSPKKTFGGEIHVWIVAELLQQAFLTMTLNIWQHCDYSILHILLRHYTVAIKLLNLVNFWIRLMSHFVQIYHFVRFRQFIIKYMHKVERDYRGAIKIRNRWCITSPMLSRNIKM